MSWGWLPPSPPFCSRLLSRRGGYTRADEFPRAGASRHGELIGFRELDGINLASDEWTDDLGDTQPHFLYVTVGESGDGISDSASEINPYRCVTGPQLH